MLHIAMYHYVRDLKYSRYPRIKGLDIGLFKRQIEFLKNNFKIVSMEEVIEACHPNGRELPENALLLTFDDGYIDHYTMVFPVLKANRIQGSFFISGKVLAENVLLDVNKIHFILASGRIRDVLEDLFRLLDIYRKEKFCRGYNGLGLSNEQLFEKYAVPSRFDIKETVFVKTILQNVLPEKLRKEISSELFKKYVQCPEAVFSRELYMSLDQIKCMKDAGMYIGVHGYGHYWLGKLPEHEMKADIDKALEVMSDFIEKHHFTTF